MSDTGNLSALAPDLSPLQAWVVTWAIKNPGSSFENLMRFIRQESPEDISATPREIIADCCHQLKSGNWLKLKIRHRAGDDHRGSVIELTGGQRTWGLHRKLASLAKAAESATNAPVVAVRPTTMTRSVVSDDEPAPGFTRSGRRVHDLSQMPFQGRLNVIV